MNMPKAEFTQPDLSHLPTSEIHTRLLHLAKTERRITHLLLWHLIEAQKRKFYLDYGHESLYKYLTQSLHYSESQAYDRMQAARLLQENPEISEKIQKGGLKLTQLVKVQSCIKQEQKKGVFINPEKTQEILKQIENKSSFETEKVLAIELNHKPLTINKVKAQSDGTLRLELTLSQEQYEVIQKAQDLLSHIIPDKNLAEVFTYLAKRLTAQADGAVREEKGSEE